MQEPDNFIDRFFWKREKKRVIHAIVNEYPQLAELDEPQIFSHYFLLAIQAHQQAEKLATAADGEPRMLPLSILLQRAMAVWSAGSPKLHFVYLLLQYILEVDRLEHIIKFNQDREDAVKDLANHTIRIVETVQGLLDPRNKLN